MKYIIIGVRIIKGKRVQTQINNVVIWSDCVSGTWFSSSVDWFPVSTVDSATK